MRALRIATIVVLGFVPTGVYPALAQTGGLVRGAVVDEQGGAVDGATVVVSGVGNAASREIQTSATGEYAYEGLPSGLYTIRAHRGDLGSEIFRIRVRDSQTVTVNFSLEPGRRAAAYLSEAGEREALAQVFSAGVAASRAGENERAAEQFSRALEISPACLECHFNLAVTYVQLGRLADAELQFQRAIVLRPDYVAAYYGLSDVYFRQGRDTEAAELRAEARQISVQRLETGRAQARDRVAQGLEFLNAGNLGGAIGQFEAAIELDQSFAAAHYWLGLAFQRSGLVPQSRSSLERYLQFAPDGEFADQTRQLLNDLEP